MENNKIKYIFYSFLLININYSLCKIIDNNVNNNISINHRNI